MSLLFNFSSNFASSPSSIRSVKDSSYCVVYDVVVNAMVVSISSSDETGRTRAMVSFSIDSLSVHLCLTSQYTRTHTHQVCTQALDLISRQFKEEMDTQYKILRVSNNYKGMSEYSDSSPVRSCAVPDEQAFHSLHQIFITPTDVEIINSVQEAATPTASRNRNSNPKKNGRDAPVPVVKAVPPIAGTIMPS